MNDESDSAELVDLLAAEYFDRKQRGEKPTIAEYCERYPDDAAELREMLQVVELADVDNVSNKSAVTRHQESEPPPKRIGGYRIIGEIGRGGMGVVYEAESMEGSRVALKVLPNSLSDNKRAIARFEREAKAIGSLQHNHIVPLVDAGEVDGRFFLTMRLINGKSLADMLCTRNAEQNDDGHDYAPGNTEWAKRFVQPESDPKTRINKYHVVAEIGWQIADALEYAHAMGIIHRDVKPANLLMDGDGAVWLTDFGLAKTDEIGLTRTGDFVGTLRYMAPERFQGDSDERADIYSLGLTLYELLVDRPAFHTSSRLKLIDLISNSMPPAPRSIDPKIPRTLQSIVLKAIEKNPQRRYQSANDMGMDLKRFVAEPLQPTLSTALANIVRWVLRSPN